MKRTLSLILILTMLLSLAACGSKDAAPTDDGNVPSQEQGGGTTGTPDEPEQPEQTQPAEQEPADSKPEQTQPADNSKPKQEPAGEPEKEPAKQPEQKPEPKPAEKPAEGTSAEPPTETPKPETPAEDKPAALVHMMNLNTFTCGAFHVADANNVARLADDLRTTIQAKRWMCGFPDKLVIVTVGQSVFSVYGNEELVNTFRDKLLASYPTAAAVYDEAINA